MTVAAEIQSEAVDSWKTWIDRALLTGQEKVSKNLVEILSFDLAILGRLEIHQQIARDQIRIPRPTKKEACLKVGFSNTNSS